MYLKDACPSKGSLVRFGARCTIGGSTALSNETCGSAIFIPAPSMLEWGKLHFIS
jgi:hypothetical protein